MIGPRPFLYVNVGHIMKLTGCKETYCYAELKKMRIKFNVVKPHRVTVDMVCNFYNLSEDQFFSVFKEGGNRGKIDPNTPPSIPPAPPLT